MTRFAPDVALNGAEKVLQVIARTAVENEQYFCDLDAVAGDGDFGFSLARGFEKLLSDWDEIGHADVGSLLKKSASILTSRMGGTSGPIWGTAFLRAGVALSASTDMTPAQLVSALRGAAEGIMKRGNANLGDKTLLDALVPAIDSLEAALKAGADLRAAVGAAAKTARNSAEATRGMLALRGRASYCGERSRDSVDAGAVAIAVMFEAVEKTFSA